MRDLERFRAAVGTWAAGGTGAPADAAIDEALTRDGVTTVVLVEGISDRHAVEALAVLQDRDLAREGVCVVPMGGAMSAGRFLRIFGAPRFAVNVRVSATRPRRATSGAGWSRPVSGPA